MFQRWRGLVLVVLCLSAGEARSVLASYPIADDQAILQSIHGLLQENYARFPHGVVHFRLQVGSAGSAAAARAGRIEQVAEADGLLIFDVKHTRFQVVLPPDVLAKATTWTSAQQASSSLQSFRLTTNGDLTLRETLGTWRDGSPISGQGLHPGVAVAVSDFEFPLTLGIPQGKHRGLSDSLQVFLQKNPVIQVSKLDVDAVRDGIKLVHLGFTYDGFQQDCWVDLEHGAIPVYDRLARDNTAIEEFCDDIRAVTGHGWLPFLWTRFSGRQVKRIVVTQADFDHPPASDQFAMTFATPVALLDPATRRPFVGDHQVWNLDRLPPITGGPAAAPSPNQVQPSLPTLPGEVEGRSLGLAPMALGVIGLLVLGLVGWAALWRRSRNRTA